jgi:hypothetical protein
MSAANWKSPLAHDAIESFTVFRFVFSLAPKIFSRNAVNDKLENVFLQLLIAARTDQGECEGWSEWSHHATDR